jgi:outer membrane immunogenic protein
MRRFSAVPIAAVCAIAFAHVSTAADIPAKAPRPAVSPFPIYNWTGFYVGGNLGGAWSTTDWTFFNGATFEPTSQNAASWVVGAQVAYLHQFSPNSVAGPEFSWSGANLKATSVSDAVDDRLRESKRSDLLLVTGRLGYAADNWLGRVKSGSANSKIGFNTFVASTGQPSTTSNERNGGWTVGVDAFNRFVGAGAEYNFARINIADRNQSVNPGFVTPQTVTTAHDDIQTVWTRVTFRPAPLIRSY